MFRSSLLFIFALLVVLVGSDVHSQTIWTGPNITFTKAANADPTTTANQDRITDNVWITRDSSRGIYNIKTESSYASFASPADTEWAFPFNNPLAQAAEFTATNWAALTFEDWETAFGSSNFGGPPSILNQPSVLHLITDNIYLDIKFLPPWGGNGDGGFTYERSTAIPEPAWLGFIGLGSVFSVVIASRPKRGKRV